MCTKKIVFLISRFLDGGIDTVMTEYLRRMAADNSYSITLAIGVKMNNLEVFLERLPSNIKVMYLVQDSLLIKYRIQKINGTISVPAKLFDEIILNPVRRFKTAKMIRELEKSNDCFIDFDCCFSGYLKHVNIRKITFIHFSFKQLYVQNRARTQRIAKRLIYYDKIVTISQAMKDEGVELFPYIKDKMTVIYNAVDPDVILEKAGMAVDNPLINRPYIVAIERLEENQKDITTLLKAYKILTTEYHRDEYLYLIGKGNSESQLKELAKELDLQDKVFFLGFQENPYPWIKNSRILVHSSKFEGLPTTLIEGLFLGKVIVSTDCPTGPKEILDNGRAGILTPVGDALSMAQALFQVLTDESKKAEILYNAQKWCETFTFHNTKPVFDRLLSD